MPAEDDLSLIQRFCRDRAHEAFEVLARKYMPFVFRTCRDILSNLHDAEDATQSVFMILAARSQRLRRQRRPLRLAPWLHRVCVYVCRDMLRASRIRSTRELEAKQARVRLNTRQTPRTQARWDLEDAIDRLPEKYRKPALSYC